MKLWLLKTVGLADSGVPVPRAACDSLNSLGEIGCGRCDQGTSGRGIFTSYCQIRAFLSQNLDNEVEHLSPHIATTVQQSPFRRVDVRQLLLQWSTSLCYRVACQFKFWQEVVMLCIVHKGFQMPNRKRLSLEPPWRTFSGQGV